MPKSMEKAVPIQPGNCPTIPLMLLLFMVLQPSKEMNLRTSTTIGQYRAKTFAAYGISSTIPNVWTLSGMSTSQDGSKNSHGKGVGRELTSPLPENILTSFGAFLGQVVGRLQQPTSVAARTS